VAIAILPLFVGTQKGVAMSNYFHIAARAGAGTGKTYSLVENYISSLLGTDPSNIKKRPQQILALTFTQKAAHEMRLRVALKLNELLSDNNNPESPNKDELRRILRALPNATIATFHSFCANLLRQEAQSLGLDDQFAILAPHEERRLAKNILRPLIMAHIENHNPVIRSLAARFRLGQGLISSGLINGLLECYYKLAEFGTCAGSLSDLTPSVSLELLDNDVKNIKKALDQLSILAKSPASKERVREISSRLSFFDAGFVKSESELAALWTALRTSVKGNFGDKEARQELVARIICFGAHLVDYFVFTDEQALIQILRDFHVLFENIKHNENKLSYADLLLKTRDALAFDKNLRRRVKSRFAHILVDEYQDTSPIQEQIIALIAENKNAEQELENTHDMLGALDFTCGTSLFVVGDKKQSIYGFRGANINLFDRMINKMALTHENSNYFATKLLTINRRSQKNILALINLVSQNTLADQDYRDEENLEPWLSDSPGVVELWVSDPIFVSKNEAHSKTCAHGIAQLLSSRSDLSASDIVVLVRRIKSATPIKEELASLGIAARIVGGDGFFQQQEVVDLIAALKLINNPGDELASAIVFRSPLVLLEDSDLLTITAQKEKLNLSNAEQALHSGRITKESAHRLQIFLTALEDIRAGLLEHDLAWALDILINRTNLAFNIGLHNKAQAAWANINKLCSISSGNGADFYALIDEYFDHIFNNPKEAQALGNTAEHLVTIMTIHQSKGLEFNVVILADTESPLPHNQHDFLFDANLGLVLKPRNRPIAVCAPNTREEYELFGTRFDQAKIKLSRLEEAEQARLLYVALTRAQKELYVISSKAHVSPSGPRTLLSLFLQAAHQKPEEFSALCPVKNITYAHSIKNLKNNLISSDTCKIFKPEAQTTRWFSSQLLAPERWNFVVPTQNFTHASALIDGNLAHQILGQAGAMLVGFEDPERDTLKHLIDASFRAQPKNADDKKVRTTLKACLITLEVLAKYLTQAHRVIFEMPLFYWPNAHTVVEGFADLVLDMPDFIGVIEFKSSLRLATHSNTYLQVFAYAQALAMQASNNKPIKYAVLLVGHEKDITWNDFDAQCSQALSMALEAME